MNDALLRMYHRLPVPARSAAATLRGAYLRWWRYGPETERMAGEALERDRWTAERWKAWQEERLAFVLHRAATRVPYYRQHWESRRRRGDRATWELLENWPVLEKEPLRNNALAFVAEDCDTRRMFHECTSGTTGTPIELWRSRTTLRALYALSQARVRSWNGVAPKARRATLTGQLVAPVGQRRPPFWVWNRAHNQLCMSSYHLAPTFLPYYLEALRRYGVVYLSGYSSSLYALAQEALRSGWRDSKVAVAVSSAEPLFDYQREAISQAFQCPVRETYGMGELVTAASECQAGRLHLWPEMGWMEVLQGEMPLPAGKTGDLVCTGLLDADMPLIRYRVRDRGAAADWESACECGRLLPTFGGVEGRLDDVLHTRDGRQIGRLDHVFKGQLPVHEAQIVQEALDRVRVRYVRAPGFGPETTHSLIERLQMRMGEVEVVLEEVDAVPRTANGKMRAVICNLSAADREAALGAAEFPQEVHPWR